MITDEMVLENKTALCLVISAMFTDIFWTTKLSADISAD